MSALTVYWTATADTLLTNAVTMVANSAGAAATGANGVTVSTAASGWGEFWFRAGQPASWPNLGAMGSPTGHGAILDTTLLDGQTIIAGSWSPTIRHTFQNANANATANVVMNFYDYDGVSTYTLIGSSTTNGVTLSSVTATLALTAPSLSAYTFATGHKLYIDVWLQMTANSNTATTAQWRLNEANSTTQGSNTSQIVTPGYVQIAPTVNIVGNSALAENAILIAATTSAVSNSALVETAQIVANASIQANVALSEAATLVAPASFQSNSLISEAARIIAPAMIQSNAALSEAAQIIASGAFQANSALTASALLTGNAALQANSAFGIASAFILALATLQANSALIGAGSSTFNLPHLPAPSGQGALSAAPTAGTQFGSAPSAATATSAPSAGTVIG